MMSYKKILNNYDIVLNLVKEDKDCCSVLENIKCKVIRMNKRDKIIQLIFSLLAIISFICAGVVLWNRLSEKYSISFVFVCIGLCLGIVGFFEYGMYFSLFGETGGILNTDTVQYINSILKSKYTVECNDTCKLLFKKGKCYIYYSDIGVVEERGNFEEGKCKLEYRKYYELHTDCSINETYKLEIVEC